MDTPAGMNIFATTLQINAGLDRRRAWRGGGGGGGARMKSRIDRWPVTPRPRRGLRASIGRCHPLPRPDLSSGPTRNCGPQLRPLDRPSVRPSVRSFVRSFVRSYLRERFTRVRAEAPHVGRPIRAQSRCMKKRSAQCASLCTADRS